jgi:diketogulonate reductase-like aldo/keto reductase
MIENDTLRYTKLALSDGFGAIPALGFGTLIPDPIATKHATKAALEAGFRGLDTAERYRTEKEVGEAMKEVFEAGKIKREDVFVATKLWNTNHRPERVKPAFEASLKRLQLDYVDLYLIHTPFAFQPGDVQDPRDTNGNVIYDKGVNLLDTWGALVPWWNKSRTTWSVAGSLSRSDSPPVVERTGQHTRSHEREFDR